MGTKLTIRDIARLAGVSKSTVSRVLNQSASVDAATRELVLRVMKQHDFIPSIAATGLRGRSKLIGVIVPALTWELMLEIIMSIGQVIEKTPYEIILYCCPAEKDYSEIVDRILATKLIGGLLAMNNAQSLEHLIALHEQGLPVVLVNTPATRVNLPLVVAANYSGAYQAVRHLLQLGHRRIAYIQGPLAFACCHDRYQGYCDALRDVGLSFDPVLCQQGHFSSNSGRVAAEALFALDEPPTAIFAGNDHTAYGVLDVAKERGIRIPEDVALVGFDDIPPSAQTHPALTTIHQPFRDMGRCATELLLSLLDPQYVFPSYWASFAASYLPSGTLNSEEEEGMEKPLQIQLPTNLVVRESCGIVSADEARLVVEM